MSFFDLTGRRHSLLMAFFACLMQSLDVAAQKLEAVSLEDAVTDNTAWNSSTCHKLDDGRYCPVVKVEFNQPACNFEGGIFEGKKPVFKTNEYWVYMLPGARHLIIKHPSYDKIDVFFDEVNPEIVRLKEKHTYILKLKGEVKKGLESVEKGDTSAMLKMAQNYEKGTGSFNKNLQQALEWYEKAAEAGSIEAQEYLAEVLYRGINGFTRHQEKALRWNEACAQRGKASCYLPLAELYTFNKQDDQVIKWLRMHCETKKNDIPQIVRLGKLIGVDKQEGFKWLKLASEAGNKEANLLCLQQMKKKSPKDAVPFYKRAIDGGDMVATNEYAQILMEGKYGIPKDEIEAKRLLGLAASVVFNTYSNYKSDDSDFQSYINSIPQLISKVKNRDVKAMISLALIYRALGDKDMMERILTIIRYNLSNGLKLPHTFDYYLEQKANYNEMDYEKLVYEGLDFSAVDKGSYFRFMREVIDNVVLASNPSFTFVSNYSEKYSWDTPKDEITKLLVRWAKDYYDKDCLSRLENQSVLSVLPIHIHYKEHRRDIFRNFQISYYDGTMTGNNEYEHRVIMAMYSHAKQNWKLGSYPYYDNYKWAFKQLEKYAEQAQKKQPTFADATRYTSWLRKLKEDGYFWALERSKGSKADVLKERGKEYGAVPFEVNGVTFNMMPVRSGGTFNDDGRSKQMNHSYLVSETEVTNELWNAVMGTKSNYKPNHPAVATWDEWTQFFSKLRQHLKYGFRALTQEEWAYAAQGGQKSKGYKYSGSNDIDEVAWYDGNAKELQEVAKKKPNELGIYDMSGNAIEYTNPAVLNAAGGGLYAGAKWWQTSEACIVKPFNPKYRWNTSLKIGLRLALTMK